MREHTLCGTPEMIADQIRVLNGIYLTNWKLGKTGEAEAAFGKIVGDR